METEIWAYTSLLSGRAIGLFTEVPLLNAALASTYLCTPAQEINFLTAIY